MPVLTDAQRASLAQWRTSIAAVEAAMNDARALIGDIEKVDNSTLLENGNLDMEDLWPDWGDTWNDKRQLVIDAAEAMAEYEAE